MNIFPNRKIFIPEIEPKEIKYKYKLWKKFFINKNVNLSKLRLSNIGIYSMSKPKYAIRTINIIKKYFNKNENIVITETSGNMGGDSIIFAKNFSRVNTVEIVKLHYEILKNNLKQYKLLNKVNIKYGDYLDYMLKFNQNVVYIDAPWGGKDYKSQKYIDLYLDNISIIDISNELKNRTKIVV